MVEVQRLSIREGRKAAGSPATREEKEKDTFYCVF